MNNTTYNRMRNPRGKYDYIVLDNLPGRNIIFRNLSGGPTVFNPNNKDRTFAVVIDDMDFVNSLISEGWKVKIFEPKRDGDIPKGHITVKAQFKPVVPKIFIEREDGSHVRLTEETIGILDDADILNVRLAINGRQVFPNGGGEPYPKAYVAEMVVKLAPSIFGIDYSDAIEPDSDELTF